MQYIANNFIPNRSKATDLFLESINRATQEYPALAERWSKCLGEYKTVLHSIATNQSLPANLDAFNVNPPNEVCKEAILLASKRVQYP